QIGDALQAKGVCSKADFLAAVNAYPFTEASLSKIPYNSAKMCYRLEGYLYPDTYQFYKNMKAQDAIGKMLQNADSHIANKYSFQTVILASIIQREVPDVAGMRNVSAVFHNRLKDTKAFPYLGSDATVIYLTRYIQGVSPALMNKYKYFYNTNNRIHGLPVGPICSPGAQALYAAANPAGANYLYFWSDSTGKYYYSLTAQGTTSSAGTVSSKP
ncbi:MAG: endolytic transglycosylase MltG, partial [Clostridia bacterium]|nr:endolytic transglycosylase MltG [Clostridia bacterium]